MSTIKSKQLEGVHADQLLDNFITATVDPTASNDSTQGYKPSSIWVNTTATPKRVFICSSNTVGAAVWVPVLDTMIGSNGIAAGVKGLVPQPAISDNTKYLKGDGTWSTPSGTSSAPPDYNSINLSFSTNTLTYSGVTNVLGVQNSLNSSVVVSGAAGWRYVVSSSLGVVTTETIPVAEIVADTDVYSPSPVYSVGNSGYYSTVNTSLRIIGVCYFNGTNIIRAIPYGHGSNKNDDFWYFPSSGIITTTNNSRLQLTAAPNRSMGDNVSCQDNGIGTSDNEGFRITANKSGYLKINIPFVTQANATSNVAILCNKNGVYYKLVADSNNQNAASFQTATMFSSEALVELGDYFTFYVLITSGTGQFYIGAGAEITFKEF